MKYTQKYFTICSVLLLLVVSCDQNEFSPEIADQEFMVNEHSEAGTVVGTIVAHDADEEQQLSFLIVDGNQAGGFALDESTGQLLVSNPEVLDFETSPEFLLEISVCDNHEEEPLESSANVAIHLQNIYEWTKDLYGLVQKGPYINGAQLTVFELSQEMNQTGRAFHTEINDNNGTWELPKVELNTPYVKIKANGFYFNECLGEISSAQLSLKSLVKVDEVEYSNINILSHLESDRQLFLIKNEGMSFSDAKIKAHQEILQIFDLDQLEVSGSEQLDISQIGEGNSALLAISLILQGYTTVGEMSELLALISDDIQEDGRLDNPELGSRLINNARNIKLEDIRKHIEERYASLGQNVTIPDFETTVGHFIENTSFEFTDFIKYPSTGNYGTNILDRYQTEYPDGDCSMAAVLPEGASLKVKIQGTNWFYSISQDWSSWEKSDWNDIDNFRYFTSKKTGNLDFKLLLKVDADTTGTVSDTSETTYAKTKIFVYENGVVEPTWTKEITVK